MTTLDPVHARYVLDRRVSILRDHLAPLLPEGGRILDVGAGDGRLAAALAAARPDITIEGIDPLVRPGTLVPVREFDGRRIPFDDGSVDAAILVDVIHHADDGERLLREAVRVARHAVVIKDHLRDGFLAEPTLRFMDRVGNARHGVALPYHYRSEAEWRALFRAIGVRPATWETRLGLYPWPASWLFDRGLHVITTLVRA